MHSQFSLELGGYGSVLCTTIHNYQITNDVSVRQGNTVLSKGGTALIPQFTSPLSLSQSNFCARAAPKMLGGSPCRDGSLGEDSNPRDDAGRKLGREIETYGGGK